MRRNINIVEKRIYNRWGALVQNGNTPWDGKANGKEQASGTFVYYAQVEKPDIDKPGQIKTVAQQGSSTLLRYEIHSTLYADPILPLPIKLFTDVAMLRV